MLILHSLLNELKDEFASSGKSEERKVWFLHPLVAVILPFTPSKTSCLLRIFRTLFGFTDIGKTRYYTFMTSPKLPWDRLWSRFWKMISDAETNGRLIVALDDYINSKTGKNVFGCDKVFDHPAKQNQSQYPRAQNIVALGLLKVVKGCWACPPLCQRDYFFKDKIKNNNPTFNRILRRQVEDRGWIQRAETGNRQRRNPVQKSGGGKKTSELLHDGHFTYLDLRLSPGENSMSEAYG